MAGFSHQLIALILASVLSGGVTTVSASQTPTGKASHVVGAVVRFTADATSVDVTIGQDNPAVRDFLMMLPLSVKLQEFNRRQKIAYLPRKLRYNGSLCSHPKDGDLIYFIPWGNLGLYYDTTGFGYSDQTVHIGTYKASLKQLENSKVRRLLLRSSVDSWTRPTCCRTRVISSLLQVLQ